MDKDDPILQPLVGEIPQESALNKKEIVREYIKKHRYFSLSQIARDTNLDRKILMDYLFQLKEEKNVFDAGYGCYSSVERSFDLPIINRTQNIIQFIKKEFPFVTDYTVWDTNSLQLFYRHTQSHHITFVDVEKEVASSVYERLYKKFQNVLREQRSKSFFASFDVTRDPVIVRGLISRAPRKSHLPTMEKILIDMLMDLDKYNYIARNDYLEIWRDLIQKYRLDVRIVYSYSKRRNCFETLLSQLADIKNSYGIEICQLLQEIGKSL